MPRHPGPVLAIKKAQVWCGDLGTEYNQTIAKLIYNAFADALHKLSKQYRPLDHQHIYTVILEGTERFEEEVRTYCKQLVERVTELWRLGVFHWDECRIAVFGRVPVASPSTPIMGRSKKSKAVRKANKAKKNLAIQNDKSNNNSHPKHTQARRVEAAPIAVNPNQVEVAGRDHWRGGGPRAPFNPSTINDRAAGDEDLTLLDATPARAGNGSGNTTLVEESATSGPDYYDVDTFLAASAHDMRDHLPRQQKISVPSPGPQRSLLELYEQYPEMRLTSISEQTLTLAGQFVKRLVCQATFEFLQKCIPEADREKLWSSILRSVKEGDESILDPISIAVPDGVLDVKDNKRPLGLLISNSISTLSSNFSTTDAKALKSVFGRGITLCDALNDMKRRVALERALHSLHWLILGLECKTTQVYRSINQALDQIPLSLNEEGVVVVAPQRLVLERESLRNHKLTYDGFKEPFEAGFVESLRTLMNLEDWTRGRLLGRIV